MRPPHHIILGWLLPRTILYPPTTRHTAVSRNPHAHNTLMGDPVSFLNSPHPNHLSNPSPICPCPCPCLHPGPVYLTASPLIPIPCQVIPCPLAAAMAGAALKTANPKQARILYVDLVLHSLSHVDYAEPLPPVPITILSRPPPPIAPAYSVNLAAGGSTCLSYFSASRITQCTARHLVASNPRQWLLL